LKSYHTEICAAGSRSHPLVKDAESGCRYLFALRIGDSLASTRRWRDPDGGEKVRRQAVVGSGDEGKILEAAEHALDGVAWQARSGSSSVGWPWAGCSVAMQDAGKRCGPEAG
jgi:hypothetical protein